jgi:hypothetical protein
MKGYDHLREQVKDIEQRLRSIVECSPNGKIMEWSQQKREQLESLICLRKELLDKMFVATPKEVVRMERVNDLTYASVTLSTI